MQSSGLVQNLGADAVGGDRKTKGGASANTIPERTAAAKGIIDKYLIHARPAAFLQNFYRPHVFIIRLVAGGRGVPVHAGPPTARKDRVTWHSQISME
jgi:hypothetical protein